MADYCKECLEELFGADTKDFANLSKKRDTKKGLYCSVICERCGPIQVDHTGLRVTPREEN